MPVTSAQRCRQHVGVEVAPYPLWSCAVVLSCQCRIVSSTVIDTLAERSQSVSRTQGETGDRLDRTHMTNPPTDGRISSAAASCSCISCSESDFTRPPHDGHPSHCRSPAIGRVHSQLYLRSGRRVSSAQGGSRRVFVLNYVRLYSGRSQSRLYQDGRP